MFRVLANMYASDEGRDFIVFQAPMLSQNSAQIFPFVDFKKLITSADDQYKLTGAVILYCTNNTSLIDFVYREKQLLNRLHIAVRLVEKPNYGFQSFGHRERYYPNVSMDI